MPNEILDYRGIEALYLVQETQSFEVAAKKLHVTQSAISQRIKALETRYGKPVLTRILPYQATELGKQLIGHFKRICLLEDDLERQIKKAIAPLRFSIALNRDSLETWFLDMIEETTTFRNTLLEVVADDQELTLSYLKNGRVSACLSTTERAIVGGQVHFLGNMEYLLVASPTFIKNYFSKRSIKDALPLAPAIKFDQNDMLHERYMEKYFHLNGKEWNYHVIPSVRGFKRFALLGYGYGLLPRLDIAEELKKKQLLPCADAVWKIPLYWHSWAIESTTYRQVNEAIIKYLADKLK